LGLCFGVFPLVLSFIIVSSFRSEFSHGKYNANTIATEGIESTGTIVRIDTNAFATINGIHPRKVFFQYDVNGVPKIDFMDTVSVTAIADWPPGYKVTIRLLGDEATIPSLEPVEAALPGMLTTFQISAFGFLFLIYSGTCAYQRLKILKYGEQRMARLVGLASSPLQGFLPGVFSKSKQLPSIVTYSYVGKGNKNITSRSQTRDTLFLNERDEIKILVLPDHEGSSLLLDGSTLSAFADY